MDHERGALERLHACAERSLYTVATGQYRQARANAAECVDEAERALESINRESAAAEDVLNSCLYVVRALIAMRQTAAAREETIRCRVMVPDLTPRGTRHPPEVVSLVRRVDLELADMAQRLVVETSEPGCGVYINGRRLGSTPLTLDSLHAATYRVQVECDPDVPGRVHEVELTEPTQRVFVDSRYETVVRSRRGPGHRDGSIELRYDTRADEARLRLADGVRTGRVLEAGEVWLVEREVTGFVRVDRVDVGSGRVLASGRLALEPDAQGFRGHALGEVIVAMASGRSLDASGDRTARMSPWVPPVDAEAATATASRRASPPSGRVSVDVSSSRSLGRPRRVALGLGVTGLAATGAGWG
ncbi:MAG: PEGA domain-containing protein, partial [Polyangiaceae bacterium]|nr:PEGA domain-containing protein [Polyangiaceae bacterium]